MNKQQDKSKQLLFTPGPLNTSAAVKQAAMRDLGSRDPAFSAVIANVRERLLRVADVGSEDYTAILLPGSGTYAIEATLQSISTPETKWLVLSNGAYARRIAEILSAFNIDYELLDFSEDQMLDLIQIKSCLAKQNNITHIAMVHGETSSGILNDIDSVGALAKQFKKIFFVDAMSSFAGELIDFERSHIDYLVSSSNKCVEGLPGVGFIITKKNYIEKLKVYQKNYCFSIYKQHCSQENKKQFLFTPPVQIVLALQQALIELELEGGVAVRHARYQKCNQVLGSGMQKLGFTCYLPDDIKRSVILTTFNQPNHSHFNMQRFYDDLYEKGFSIYPGKQTNANTFRICNIGKISVADTEALLSEIQSVLAKSKRR